MSAEAILAAWSHLSIRQSGAQWIIAGYDPYGKFRLGHREDAIGLARDLVEIAEREKPIDTAPINFDVPVMDSQEPPVSPPANEEVDIPPRVDFDTGEAAGSPLHGSSPLYAGTAMTEDEVSKWRAELMIDIDNRAADILADAEVDPARQAYLTNGRMLHLLTEAEGAELDRIERLYGWTSAVHAHAADLKSEVAVAGPDYLEIFDVGDGWPAAPG